MVIYLLKILILAILFILLILIIRAIRFKPAKEKEYNEFDVELDEDKIINNFVQMIRCRTVSYKDTSLEDVKEFEKFRRILADNYPNINSKCQRYYVGRTGVLYHWKGKSHKKPIVLMAHYDVVPAIEGQWDKEPFSAVIEDGHIWGRGTLDTKGTLCAIMEACEKLISEGFIPENDIYLSFSGDEETNGSSTNSIVEFLEEKGIRPFMVLDEGGAIVEGVIPGVKKKCALIGTGEKGKMHIRLSTKTKGGHASSPPPISPIGRLSKSVIRIEKRPFKFHMSQPVKDMFNTVGRYSSFPMKIIFANLPFFSPLLNVITRKVGGELNALVRTTVAFTKMEGSDAVNVFPPYASVEGDIRIMEGDTGESIIEGLRKRIKDDKVEVESVDLIPVKPFSSMKTEGWKKLEESIKEIWGDIIVSPYLMIACSDSRHYTKICENVYRFSAMELDNEERGMIHGNNERIPIDKLITTVKFYINLIKKF